MLSRRHCCCGGLSGCHVLVSSFTGAGCVNVHDIIECVDSTLGHTVDMVWDATSTDWIGLKSYAYPGGGGCPARTVTLTYYLDSQTGDFGVLWNGWLSDSCPDDDGDVADFGIDFGLQILNRITMTDCEEFTASVSPTTTSGNVTKLYPAGTHLFTFTSISATSCCVRVRTRGCNNLRLNDVTVAIGSGVSTSGPTGVGISSATVDIGSGGTKSYSVSKSRFNTLSGSDSFVCGDDTDTYTLTPATGYRCITGCADPIPETLNAFHPTFGAIQYTYSGGSWIAVVIYDYPGFGSCPAKTGLTVTCTWNGTTGYTEAWKTASGCPDPAGGTTTTATWSGGPATCPPEFSVDFQISPSAGAQQNLYQSGSTQSLIITE